MDFEAPLLIDQVGSISPHPCDWIHAHGCWHINNDPPSYGSVYRRTQRVQVGSLSELADRVHCETCHKIYSIAKNKAWLFEGYAERDVACTITDAVGLTLYFHGLEVRSYYVTHKTQPDI